MVSISAEDLQYYETTPTPLPNLALQLGASTTRKDLRDGLTDKYIVDLTGGQYGWQEIVTFL